MCVWSCPNLCESMTLALQAPLSMGFPRQEYWSGLPFPCSGLVFFMSPKSCLLSFWNWNVAPVKKCLFWVFFFPQGGLGKMGLSFKNIVFWKKNIFQKWIFGICLYIVFIFQKIYFVGGNLPSKEYLRSPNLLNLFYYDILGPSGFLSPCTWSSVGNSPFKGFQV